MLQAIFGMSGARDAPARGMGRMGVILDGHDHEGCDVWHYLNRTRVEGEEEAEAGEWAAVPYPVARRAGVTRAADVPGIREITVRSMMGSYGGSAGLLSAWYQEPAEGAGGEGKWEVEYAACPFVVQHVWWAVHIVDIVLLGLIIAAVVAWCREWWADSQMRKSGGRDQGELLKLRKTKGTNGSASVNDLKKE